ncbi:MAG: purine-nucleoside phosphorylase [Flavobacteriales bacterium]|nr:purine-nucleoside phosphorylase [Flavobacteriales bacterium]MCZ2443948.1 purine-nucleoside phosphorylase [Flavobacteriales bacterium]
MQDRLKEAIQYIQGETALKPEIGIILGSGLGGLVNEIKIKKSIPYNLIPSFPISTVEGHHGNLIFGFIAGKAVVIMQGRFHYYEGYSMQQVTFPVRIMKELGIHTLLISNAAGGMNPAFSVGDIMLITDHISLFPESPLRGPNEASFGTRFPDMSSVYCKSIIASAKEVALAMHLSLQEGVYAGVQGPCFETPAEYRYLRIIGADAVGMSTVPEAIVATHAGIKCFGVSVITDLGIEGQVQTISHAEVIKAANEAGSRLTQLFVGLMSHI